MDKKDIAEIKEMLCQIADWQIEISSKLDRVLKKK